MMGLRDIFTVELRPFGSAGVTRQRVLRRAFRAGLGAELPSE